MSSSRFLSFAVFAFSLLSNNASYAAPQRVSLTCASATGIKTEASVEAAPNNGIYNVFVDFIGKKPSKKEMDRVLRDCIAVAVKRDDTKDILGSPWFRKNVTDNPNDDDLLQPYDSLKYLSYEATSKRIGVREFKLK